jgi:hypothetical protein
VLLEDVVPLATRSSCCYVSYRNRNANPETVVEPFPVLNLLPSLYSTVWIKRGSTKLRVGARRKIVVFPPRKLSGVLVLLEDVVPLAMRIFLLPVELISRKGPERWKVHGGYAISPTVVGWTMMMIATDA